MQFDYEPAGNVTSVTEVPAAGSGLGNRTTLTFYDELNRPVRKVGPTYTDKTPDLQTLNVQVRARSRRTSTTPSDA